MTLSPESQSARMSKITNDSLTRSGTGCFKAVYPYSNSRRQRVKISHRVTVTVLSVFRTTLSTLFFTSPVFFCEQIKKTV